MIVFLLSLIATLHMGIISCLSSNTYTNKIITMSIAISCIVAVLPMLKYEITNKKHREIMADLNARRSR